jgi:hypothetical protein
MRKPTTGEPCAGELPARFGGRGGDEPSLPLSSWAHEAKTWTPGTRPGMTKV